MIILYMFVFRPVAHAESMVVLSMHLLFEDVSGCHSSMVRALVAEVSGPGFDFILKEESVK